MTWLDILASAVAQEGVALLLAAGVGALGARSPDVVRAVAAVACKLCDSLSSKCPRNP